MHKAERFGRAVLWNLAVALLLLLGLIGLCHAFTVESFGALAPSKQMGVVVAAALLAGGTVVRAGGVFSSLSMFVQRLLIGR